MDFDKTLKELKHSLLQVFGNTYAEYRDETQKDIDTFINNSREKLEKWTKLLSKKDISLEEFEWLVKSQKDLMSLSELEKLGVSKIRLGQLKNKMSKVIVGIGRKIILNR